MQAKYLIIIALLGIAGLLGFNIINSSHYEDNKAVAINTVEPPESNDKPISTTNREGIANKPLDEQPKAIMDKATTQINQAQQTEQERLKKMDSLQ
ncbi:hypothetical protein [Psychrobacter sp. CAL346-MNA-CIBAN-0220]|uniref:hypothetical protein n=1 Tax=Psychrobacter sp. CAL346-MNA-CIBAN-0220 TaxID=3140457 RepID=UPI003333574D